jgi:hypothetical protein
MVKKQLILIPSIILLSAVALITAWFWPKFFTENVHDNPVALIETNCDELSYNFIKLNIISKACENADVCPFDRINLIMRSWENDMNGLNECQTNPGKWSAWSYINDNEAYLRIRSDAYSLLKNSFGIEQKVNAELSYKIFEVPQNTLPYLMDDKYCKKNEDCQISMVGCTKGSYNIYSEHIFWPIGCGTGTWAVRSTDGLTYTQNGDTYFNSFQTIQLGCTDNKCQEKYILDETGEEF